MVQWQFLQNFQATSLCASYVSMENFLQRYVKINAISISAEQLIEGQKNYRNLSYSEKTERLKTLISHRSPPPPQKQEQNNNNNVDCKQRLKIYLQKICDFKSSDIIQEEKPGRTTEILLKNQCKRRKMKTDYLQSQALIPEQRHWHLKYANLIQKPNIWNPRQCDRT